jgi:hypothetical protein
MDSPISKQDQAENLKLILYILAIRGGRHKDDGFYPKTFLKSDFLLNVHQSQKCEK